MSHRLTSGEGRFNEFADNAMWLEIVGLVSESWLKDAVFGLKARQRFKECAQRSTSSNS